MYRCQHFLLQKLQCKSKDDKYVYGAKQFRNCKQIYLSMAFRSTRKNTPAGGKGLNRYRFLIPAMNISKTNPIRRTTLQNF